VVKTSEGIEKIVRYFFMTVIGIIPARYASTRFPGKMLAPIMGKTLLQRTYESAQQAKTVNRLIVATDDDRIYQHVQGFGGEVCMTSTECSNGTLRLVDAMNRYPELAQGDIFVNIQGDRPCISPGAIDQLVTTLVDYPHEMMATLVVKIHKPEEVRSPATVKCVRDLQGYALYFSRQTIPHTMGSTLYYKHIGVYAFRRDFLQLYAQLAETPLQQQEDLEQLKVLEHGYRIKTLEVIESDLSVDYPHDIATVEQHLVQTKNNLLDPIGILS
jgi:3-deoxy-manno-octulosonate cytidylyltransferase (CMP-KDO synthetase)